MNTPTQSAPPVLCDRCLAAPGLPMPHRPGSVETVCPVCAVQGAVMDDASEHLHALLSPVLREWARYWHKAGVSADQLAGLLEMEGMYWHPLGALAREGNSHERARAAVRSALD